VTSATAEVPSTVEELDATWLTRVLGATVTGVRAEQIAVGSGFSSLLYRLHLSGDVSVPGSVIVKLPAQSEARGAMDMMGGYARELAFYQQVAGRAPMGTPRVYAARMAADSTDFVLVLEDLKDWDNADHLAGLSLEQVRLCIAQLAGLHAWSTDPANSAALQGFPSLDTQMTREVFPAVFAQGWQVYCEHAAVPVPPAVARYAERFADYAATAVAALTERSMLVHGDIRADNMFFSAANSRWSTSSSPPGALAPPTSPTWSARVCHPRCVRGATKNWCVSTSSRLAGAGSTITPSTRRGVTTDSLSPT
jgi:aminoglycoside phosphotransferase (APT) family kinase protein